MAALVLTAPFELNQIAAARRLAPLPPLILAVIDVASATATLSQITTSVFSGLNLTRDQDGPQSVLKRKVPVVDDKRDYAL